MLCLKNGLSLKSALSLKNAAVALSLFAGAVIVGLVIIGLVIIGLLAVKSVGSHHQSQPVANVKIADSGALVSKAPSISTVPSICAVPRHPSSSDLLAADAQERATIAERCARQYLQLLVDLLPEFDQSVLGQQPLTDEELEARRRQEFEQFSQQLQYSDNAEHIITAALLQDAPAIQAQLIERAVSAEPTNLLVQWLALQACTPNRSCNERAYLQRLVVLAPENAHIRMLLANYQWHGGDKEQALESIARASASADLSRHYPDVLLMLYRSLEAAGAQAGQAALYANNLMLTKLRGGGIRVCEEAGKDTLVAAEQCLTYARRSQERDLLEIDRLWSQAIERTALDQLGRAEEAAALQRIYHRERDRRTAALVSAHSSSEFLVFRDLFPGMFYRYVEALAAEGEVGAWLAVEQEKQAFERHYLPAQCFDNKGNRLN